MITLYNLPKRNNVDRFIDIYNFGDYIIRYTGIYYVGGFPARFCTLPFFLNQHIKTSFPDDSTSVEFIVQYWQPESSQWIDFPYTIKPIPGGYCFRTSGTLMRPSFDEILCP